MRLTRRGRVVVSAAVLTVLGVGVGVAIDASTGSPSASDAAGVVPTSSSTPTPTPTHTHSGADGTHPHHHHDATPTSTPTGTPPTHPTGTLHLVSGQSEVYGQGPLHRYEVEVEGGIHQDGEAFADAVQHALGDRHGWSHVYSFQRVSSPPYDFIVVLASPHLTDQLCAPLVTGGIYSCYQSGKSVVNDYRWTQGAASYGWSDHLATYRDYVVSHEVGHALGYGHQYSCRPDGLAPTMMQQTKSLYGCERNPWPFP